MKRPPRIAASKWGKVGKVAAILVTVLLFLVGVAYLQTDVGEAAASYEKNLEAARNLGLPMSDEDVARIRSVPDKDNAAKLVLSSFDDLKAPAKWLEDAKSDWTSGDKKAGYRPITWSYYTRDDWLEKVWPQLEPGYQKLIQACQYDHLVFPHKILNPIEREDVNRGRLGKWIALIVQRAHLYERANDPENASKAIAVAARLSVLVQPMNFLVSTIRGVQATLIVQRELAKWITDHGADPAYRNAIRTSLLILDQPYDLRPSMKLEHRDSLYSTELMVGWRPLPKIKEPESEGQIDGPPTLQETFDSKRWYRSIPRFGKANISRIHEYYAKAISEYPTDHYDLAALRRTMEPLDRRMQSNQLSVVIPSMVISYRNILDLLEQAQSQTNVLRQALAILDQQKCDGSLPLGGHYKLDLDGHPLRMKKTTTGWLVYSIGRDKVDDGGSPVVRNKGDFVVHLPR